MKWPLDLGAGIGEGDLSLRPYSSDDASSLFAALADGRAWEHIPRVIPTDADALDAMIRAKLVDGRRTTLVIRLDGRIVGMTSVLFDPADPAGVEVGGTQVDPNKWGTGVNHQAKRLLLAALFSHGARWVQLRTDERNERSAAAIRKLGARDLGTHQDVRVRRDGTQRRSLLFRIDRPPS
ncbi:MAG TPA: GNAT family protein [Nocardioides sp.]|uniref:GNAT family N-acetyltransferase n=1 Tax=Nocardioides sp. TaxID=35761 RepID=UPI002CCE7B30|nr:GNAT family protein [Nocardioides sp.]HTW16826.1 GNAT family protein [Nocardioides sp.]